jgi:hypothetical protein
MAHHLSMGEKPQVPSPAVPADVVGEELNEEVQIQERDRP